MVSEARHLVGCTFLFGPAGVERQGRFLLAACFEPYSKHKSYLNAHKALNKTLPSLKTISQKTRREKQNQRKRTRALGFAQLCF